MGEISNQQIYDLILDISRGLAGLEASFEELLADVRSFNREMSSHNRNSFEISQRLPGDVSR